MKVQEITLDLSKRPAAIDPVRIGIGDRQYPVLLVNVEDNGGKVPDAPGFSAKLVMRAGDEVRTRSGTVYTYSGMYKASFKLASDNPKNNWQEPCRGTAYVAMSKGDVRMSTQRFEFEVLDGRKA